MIARKYQTKLKQEVYDNWKVYTNVAVVLACGGGKTFILSEIIKENLGASCVIAHRQELVGQISLSLARQGIYHKIIAPRKVIQFITWCHVQELGESFYEPDAKCAVAGVGTITRRHDELKDWLNQVTLWVIDECHHLISTNQWGKACKMFPNARGLGVTATLCRADGKGLGRHADGLMDCFVEGPTMRELINQGYLTDYKIFAPPVTNFNLDDVPIGASGDFSKKQLKQSVRKSTIMGDVVDHYIRIAKGKIGLTFATDVETAQDIADGFNAAGIPALMICGKTPDRERQQAIQKLKNKELLQLVTVDLIGEGFDLPAVEVVSFARPTESFGLFIQQFGRVLRILTGKNIGIIIDHVGNCIRHGLPDATRNWTLDRRDRKSKVKNDTIPVRVCRGCMGVYPATNTCCPYCGEKWLPAQRSLPEHVDGDLQELLPEVLAAMRGEVKKIDEPVSNFKSRLEHGGFTGPALGGAVKNHRVRQETQEILRESISWWAGHSRAAGQSDDEIYKRFYFKFGVDIMTAQTLGKKEAMTLNNKIQGDMRKWQN